METIIPEKTEECIKTLCIKCPLYLCSVEECARIRVDIAKYYKNKEGYFQKNITTYGKTYIPNRHTVTYPRK